MKKRITIVLILIIVFLSSCSKVSTYGTEFKKEHEALNGLENKNGKIHRTISVNENNPFEKVDPSEIISKIDNNQTFYLYIGDPLCPWCRSVLEKAIEIANKNKIDKIYYIDIWDDDGNEIFRDKYELEDGKAIKTINGTKEYYKMLTICDSLLKDYELTNEDGKNIQTGEKRIYAPSFIYIKRGEAKKLVTGISDKQKDSREELTKDILKDEENIFMDFFFE